MARRRAGTRKAKAMAQNTHELLVNAFTAQHGDYREATVVDLNNELGGGRQKTYRVLRVTYPGTVDKWLAEGGPGFEEPQAMAINHVRRLWACAGSLGRQVANYEGFGGGDCGRERGYEQSEALTQLSRYEDQIPRVYWSTFEMLCRDDFGAGAAGAIFADNSPQRIAHAKNCVGFCASLIAQWRGY